MSDEIAKKIRSWMEYHGLSQKEFCVRLSKAEGKDPRGGKAAKSKVDSWLRLLSEPSARSKESIYAAFCVDEDSFWKGPNRLKAPYDRDQFSINGGNVVYQGKEFEVPLDSLIQTGPLLSMYVSGIYKLLEEQTDIKWNPQEVLGIAKDELPDNGDFFDLGSVLKICFATNLPIFDLPCRGSAASEVKAVIDQIGWQPASQLNIKSVINGILLSASDGGRNILHFADMRSSLDDSSAIYIDDMSKDSRHKLAKKLDIAEREFEKAIIQQNVDLALSIHERFHLLMQNKRDQAVCGPVFHECLRLPTTYASRSEDYFSIAKEQHRHAVEIVGDSSFCTDSFRTWHRLESSFGYSSAVLSYKPPNEEQLVT